MFRFSIRELALVIALIATGIGWWVAHRANLRERQTISRERDVWKHHAEAAKWMANLGVREIEFDGDDITGQHPGSGTFVRTWLDDPSEGPDRPKRPPKPKRLP
jgi:hypothetical protein